MNKMKLPCIEYGCDEASPHCTDCEIKQRGLTNVFMIFSKKYLSRRTSDVDVEIAEKTVDSIHDKLKKGKFRGGEGYMKGAFYRFCEQEYLNRRNDVLRRNQSRFENEKITLETDLPKDADADSDFSLIDIYANSESDRKRNSRLFASDDNSILEDILDILENVALQGEPCADLIIGWYNDLKKGLKQIEMAALKNISYDSFRQKLSRCFKKMRPEILTKLTS